MSSASFVLVIDFEPRSLAKTRAVLEQAGHTVRSASSGKELKEILEREMPAVVLMEPMLPGQDGFKLCQAIKRRAQVMPLTVIVASRIYRGARYRNMAKEAGADGYFERPQQDDQIMAIINRVVPRIENGTLSPTGPVGGAPTFTRDAIAAPLVTTQPRPPIQVNPTPAAAPSSSAPSSLPSRPQAPTAASASALSRAVAASSSSAASSGLQDFSDGDIDDALSRALGESLTSPITSSSPPSAMKVQIATQSESAVAEEDPFDFDFGWTSEQPASVDLDELGLVLDEIDLTQTAAAQAPPASREKDLGFVLLPEKQSVPVVRRSIVLQETDERAFSLDLTSPQRDSLAVTPVAGPEAEPQSQISPSPVDEMQGIDDFFEQNFIAVERNPATSAPSSVSAAPIAPLFDDTPRGFSGEVLGDPALDPEPAPNTGPPPFASGANEVPESLRGMDRGTAELLSSLEELENSLPQPEAGHSTGWNDGSEFEASLNSLSSLNSLNSLNPLDDSSSGVVHERPSASAEEQSLEDMLARLTTGDEAPARANTAPPPAVFQEELLPSAPIAPIQADTPSDDDFDIDFGFDPVPAPPKKLRTAPVSAAPAIGSIAASAPMEITPAAESMVLDEVVSHSQSHEKPRRKVRSPELVDRTQASRTSGLSSVLWYALIGVVLGAVAIYVVSTFFVSDDPAAQSESTRRSATVEQSQGQSPDVTSASPVPNQGKPGSKKQAEPSLPPSTRRQIPEPASRQNAPPDRKPGEDKRRTAPASTSAANTSTAQPVSQPEETRDIRQPPQVDTSAPAPPESSPKPVQASSTGERERPQPVLAAPQVSEPASTFASGPGFTDPARLVRIADLDEPLRVLESSHPETPAQAVQAGVRGRVFLSVLVGDDGEVRDAKIMIEPGYGMGEVAKKAVQSWRYSKPKSRGESARVWKTEVIEFGGGGDQPPPENGGTEPNQAQSP